MSDTDVIQPHSHAAELAVLGSMIQNPVAIERVNPLLTADMFFKPDLATMYRCLVTMHGDGIPIELLNVKCWLEEHGHEELSTNTELFTNLIEQQIRHEEEAVWQAGRIRDLWTKRQAIDLAVEIQVLAHEGAKTADILAKAREGLVAIGHEVIERGPVRAADDAQEIIDIGMRATGEVTDGLRTGWQGLDALLYGGLGRGQYGLIAGRPSTGKSALANNIIWKCAVVDKVPTLLFSLEVPRAQVLRNLLSIGAGTNTRYLLEGTNDRAIWDKLEVAQKLIEAAPLWIDDDATATPEMMRTRAAALAVNQPLRLIVVDYLQLLNEERGKTRLEQVTEISRVLKSTCRELEVTMLALSQLSRAGDVQGDAPRLSHLRESGALEQDADLVLMLHRREGQEYDALPMRCVDLVLNKQRNGPTGTVEMRFEQQCLRFVAAENRDSYQQGA